MTAESARRVLAFLEGRATMPHLDKQEIAAVHVFREDEGRPLLTDDLIDLCRRAVLLDSMAAEIDRQGQEITRLRAQLPDEPGIIDYPQEGT